MKRQALLPNLLLICHMSRLVQPVVILNIISGNIVFALHKMIGMVRLWACFILLSQFWDFGSPLTGGAERMELPCGVTHTWPIPTSPRQILHLSVSTHSVSVFWHFAMIYDQVGPEHSVFWVWIVHRFIVFTVPSTAVCQNNTESVPRYVWLYRHIHRCETHTMEVPECSKSPCVFGSDPSCVNSSVNPLISPVALIELFSDGEGEEERFWGAWIS